MDGEICLQPILRAGLDYLKACGDEWVTLLPILVIASRLGATDRIRKEGVLEFRYTPQHCRWAEPTLYLPLPFWLDGWDSPWSCRRGDPPRPIESTEECATCPRWEARTRQGVCIESFV